MTGFLSPARFEAHHAASEMIDDTETSILEGEYPPEDPEESDEYPDVALHARTTLEAAASIDSLGAPAAFDVDDFFGRPVLACNDNNGPDMPPAHYAKPDGLGDFGSLDVPVVSDGLGDFGSLDVPVVSDGLGDMPSLDVPVVSDGLGDMPSLDVPVVSDGLGDMPSLDVPVVVETLDLAATGHSSASAAPMVSEYDLVREDKQLDREPLREDKQLEYDSVGEDKQLEYESVGEDKQLDREPLREEKQTDYRVPLLLVGLVVLLATMLLCIWLIFSSASDSSWQDSTRPSEVVAFQPPEETPIAPTVLQAEDYDVGGDEVSYVDTTEGNSGGVYRNDGVDIAAVPDQPSKLVVVNTQDGEWLRYTFRVREKKPFVISTGIWSSSEKPGSLNVLIDGRRIGTFYGQKSSTPFDFVTQEIGQVELDEGEHELELRWSGNGGIVVDWLEVGLPQPVSKVDDNES